MELNCSCFEGLGNIPLVQKFTGILLKTSWLFPEFSAYFSLNMNEWFSLW